MCSKLVPRRYHETAVLWVADLSKADVQQPCSEMVFVFAGQFHSTAASLRALGALFSPRTPAGSNKFCFDRTVGHALVNFYEYT